MITKVTLCNIRTFENETWSFPVKPITVFCGTNSSGKSTILKSLLLLKQNYFEQNRGAQIPGRLRYIGPEVDLGSFENFCSANATKKSFEISVSIDIQVSKGNRTILKVAFPERNDLLNMDEEKLACQLTATFSFAQEGPTLFAPNNITAEQMREATHLPTILTLATYKLESRGKEILSWVVRYTPSKVKQATDLEQQMRPINYQISFPRAYFEAVGGTRLFDLKSKRGDSYSDVLLNGLMPSLLSAPISKARLQKSEKVAKSDSSRHRKNEVGPLPPFISQLMGRLERTLQGIQYLGPLRSPATRYYVLNPDLADDIDSTGKFLPEILSRADEIEVKAFLPQKDIHITGTLLEVLDVWLHYIRTGESDKHVKASELKVSKTKGVIFELGVKSSASNAVHALTDSGFGYSQLLPIMIKGLLLQRGQALMVEQPELHLHPALQVRLAEFLFSIAKDNGQVIIESHSEHIVNTIRALAAEDASHSLHELTQILFINGEQHPPSVLPMDVDENGVLSAWPPCFFGESAQLASRILRAQRKSRG